MGRRRLLRCDASVTPPVSEGFLYSFQCKWRGVLEENGRMYCHGRGHAPSARKVKEANHG